MSHVRVSAAGDNVEVSLPGCETLLLSRDEAGAIGAALRAAAEYQVDFEFAVASTGAAEGAPEEPSAPAPVPAPPVLTPVVAPITAPSSVLAYSTFGGRIDVDVAEAEWTIAPSVLSKAERLDISETRIRRAASFPDYRIPAEYGDAWQHVDGGLGVLVRESTVIGLFRVDDRAGTPVHGIPRAKSGGPGKTGITTYEEMRRALVSHGFEIDEARGGGHPMATHPRFPDFRQTLPRTPSDHRSYKNAAHSIQRDTGIDVLAA